MKKIIVVMVIILVLLVVFYLAKNIIAKNTLSAGVKAITGLGLEIQDMNVGIFKTVVSVDNLKIFNPSAFTDRVMADIPEIYVDYDLGAFLKKKVHLEELRLNIKELTVVRDAKSQVNIGSLQALLPKQDKSQKMPEIKIDTLDLTIGKVIYKDYSLGELQVHEFNINLHERLQNITDPKMLAGLILAKALSKTNIASLVNIDLGPLKQEAIQTMQDAKAIVIETAQQAKDTVTGLKETAQETIQETGEDLKKLLPLGQ